MRSLLGPHVYLLKTVISRYPVLCQHQIQNFLLVRSVSDKVQTIESDEQYSYDADVEESTADKDAELERLRNKSRLYPQHLNMLHGRLPYSEAKADFHNTLLYKRKMFGRYGMKSNVNPGTLWPTQHEIGETIEYEQVAYPKSIQETVQMLLKDKEKEQNQINARQLKIAQNLKNLEQWKKDVTNRAAKKLAEVVAAKAKKDALIEEVRRHFGYKINPKDERFKELLMQKEKDQKKKLKEERAKAKQEKLLASMMKSES